MKTDQRGRFPVFEPLSGYEIPGKTQMRPQRTRARKKTLNFADLTLHFDPGMSAANA
jgi:hypothetical protein